jgi:GNAT superfamily N-acetyltransferase
MDAVRQLFRDYQEFLQVDLCFQDFEGELAGLPGAYQPPGGALILAWAMDEGQEPQVAGGVALRPLKDGPADCCEMKRLFVRDAWKGLGLGRALAEDILQAGRQLGYRRMVLDTLARLETAVELYRRLGFVSIDAYYDNPTPGVVYLECVL